MNPLVEQINAGPLKDEPFHLVRIDPHDTFFLIESVQHHPRAVLIIHAQSMAMTMLEFKDSKSKPVPVNLVTLGTMKFFARFIKKYNEGEFQYEEV